MPTKTIPATSYTHSKEEYPISELSDTASLTPSTTRYPCSSTGGHENATMHWFAVGLEVEALC
jgi:hypothetical protein